MTNKISIKEFGKAPDGHDVNIYIMKSSEIEVGFINYGAAIAFLKVIDGNGQLDDIVTGFDSLSEYMDNRTYFGATLGRVANRIAKGKFTLDGAEYSVPVNNGPNSLHGGINGFDKKIWEAEVTDDKLVFSLTSPDGDEGFPGKLDATITYTLADNELCAKYHAVSNKATPINLSNHSFFNLGGHVTWDKDLSNHEITVLAQQYLPTDENNLVTGEINSVDNSVFDLRQPVALTEDRLSKVPLGVGFDHNFCLTHDGTRKRVARVRHTVNGRVMGIDTTAPGVQLYTGNYLDGMQGKENVSYTKHSALCLECQNWPDAINHKDTFPNCVLRPDQEYSNTIWFKFSTSGQ